MTVGWARSRRQGEKVYNRTKIVRKIKKAKHQEV
jgi:hypothetical protein